MTCKQCGVGLQHLPPGWLLDYSVTVLHQELDADVLQLVSLVPVCYDQHGEHGLDVGLSAEDVLAHLLQLDQTATI